MGKKETTEKGKATITGAFFRVDKTIYDDFVRKAKDSDLDSKEGQSQKEVIAERLLELYIENGDDLWKWILKYEPKKEGANV